MQRAGQITKIPAFSENRSVRKKIVNVEPHGETGRVPAGGDDSAESALRRLLRVNVKILRIELPCKLDDLRLTDGYCPELVDVPWCIVFEIAIVGGCSEAMKRHEGLRLPRE